MPQKRFDLARIVRGHKRPSIGQWIMVGAGLVLSIAMFFFLQGFVSCWRLTAMPGMPLASCPGGSTNTPVPTIVNAQGTPVPGLPTETPDASIPQAALPPAWDGSSRVNILIMGYDYGENTDRQCPCRSDSMIVLTIDPATKTAGMLSVQRDLWANMSPYGYHKINTALFLGDRDKIPGGGAELARKTVEEFLGVPIQYYVLIDFTAFIRIIDTIGTVCMDIPQKITIDPLGPHNTKYLDPGHYCLDGSDTLAYARVRHTENGNDDIDRAKRQQQVIMAVRDTILHPGNLARLTLHAKTLYDEVSSGINTNLPLNDALSLGMLATEIPSGSIEQHVMDYTMLSPAIIYADGVEQAVLRPFPDKIRELVDQTFGGGSSNPQAVPDPTQLSLDEAKPLMEAEHAGIMVVNASGVEGIASKTSDYLKSQGVNVVNFGNTADYPDKYKYPPLPDKTLLIVHTGRPYVMQYLMKLMNTDRIVWDFDPLAPAEITLAVGADWAYNNPMP